VVTIATIQPVQGQTHYKVIYSFQGSKHSDGKGPTGMLARDEAGNLFGTTGFGGTGAGCDGEGCGTLYELDSTGRETVLVNFFTNAWGGAATGVVQDRAGNLFGSVRAGAGGAVFKLDTVGNFRIQYSFPGRPLDGAIPNPGLVLDANGNIYGTTTYGGADRSCNCGTVFKLDSTSVERPLHTFSGGADGANPSAGLIHDASGNFYGTTFGGGPGGHGAVFKMEASGNETVLHTFTYTDGAGPSAGLVRDANGTLFGTTSGGGAYGAGTVFKLDSANHLTVLHNFTGGADGYYPASTLVLDLSGNLYGTTLLGGDFTCDSLTGCGTVFKVDPDGNETVLYSFSGGKGGSIPAGDLVRDSAGNLFGTAGSGGDSPCQCGVVFELTH
jgi:uncharacterized repeat protein (TIGR03803 family)